MTTTSAHKLLNALDFVEAEQQRARRLALAAVAIATLTVFAAVVTMPLLYGYAQVRADDS